MFCTLQEWAWHQKLTAGSPPLGVYRCGFTVMGKRVLVYGGSCGHFGCYHNSLHELDTTNLGWTVMASSEAIGAPMKKGDCGVVAYINGGEEHLGVFGGYGTLNSTSRQPTAKYVELTSNPEYGWTNEFHCFASGELTKK